MRMKKLEPVHLVFAALGGLVLLFIVAPLIGMLLASSPEELSETARDPEVAQSIRLTLVTSMGASSSTVSSTSRS